MNELWTHIVRKFSSGKFLLAVMMGVTFCVLSVQGKITSGDFLKVFLIVVYAYYTKQKESQQ